MAPSRILSVQRWWFLTPLSKLSPMNRLSRCFVPKLLEHGTSTRAEASSQTVRSFGQCLVSFTFCTILSSLLNIFYSVLLGNQGQIAYVARNAYMETLASYRHSLGLPATCLQLGAWESKLVKKLEFSTGFVRPIKHEKRILLILKAILTPMSVPVIADFDVEKLASAPAYAQDPPLLKCY